MSTIEQVAPPRRPDPVGVSAKRLRRRWPLVLAACLLALIIAAGSVAFWWVATRFTPIRLNTGSLSRVRVEDGQFIRVPTHEPSTSNPITVFLFPYRKGKWLDMGITIYNYSPFDVTVEEIGYRGPDAFEGPLRQESVRIESIDAEDTLIEFRRFTLPADSGRYVVIRYRFTGCLPPGIEEPSTRTRQWIRYSMRVGWITIHRAESLPMNYTVGVQGQEKCPPEEVPPEEVVP